MGRIFKKPLLKKNTNHFSAAENSPLGKGTFLHEAIGPHRTSKFCDRVLDSGLGEADKENINFVEAYELL